MGGMQQFSLNPANLKTHQYKTMDTNIHEFQFFED